MEHNGNYESVLDSIDKEVAFDKIAALFYNRNFSTASKSEIELLMFHFYMEAMIAKNKDPVTNVLDYSACSDYNIAKQLGITQERVRSLKIKNQARYPVEYDWQKSMESLRDNIRYDNVKKKIVIPIPDPNLYLEIKNYIEQNGGYIEVQRTGNYIQILPEYYILLLYETVDDKKKKKMTEELTRELNKKNPATPISVETKKEFINHVLGITENGIGLLAALVDKIESPLTAALKGIKTIL